MMKILVIEDNESVSAMIELFFSKEGIEGEFVKDGLTGYSRAQDTAWDCLIVDWMLPGMDGVTICRTLRQHGYATPIIMLTAKDSESDQVLGLEMGADDYVTKPFSPLALMARIKAVTRRYGSSKNGQPEDGVLDNSPFKNQSDYTRSVAGRQTRPQFNTERIRFAHPFCPASETGVFSRTASRSGLGIRFLRR